MTGKIWDDPDKTSLDGTEKLAMVTATDNYGGVLATVAGWLASLSQTLTHKTIDAASNIISNIGLSMFAAGVVDTDGTLAANSDGKVATQKATKAYVDGRRLDQLVAPTGDVTLNSHKLTNVADPAGAQDAATKNYVDTVAQGLDTKPSVKAATTTNITLSGAQTIDGIALVAGDRCLVKNQSTASQNGVYVVASGSWTRALDCDAWTELPGAYLFVEQGTVNADTAWVCTVDQGGTLGTTSITFSQFAGAGTYSAGGGLKLTGTQLSVDIPGSTSAGALSDTDVIMVDQGSGPRKQGLSGLAVIARPAINAAGRAGSFDVWQRLTAGASAIAIAASTTAYANDGWYLATGANQACTITRVAGIATGSQYAAKVQRNSGQTGTGVLRYAMPLDSDEIAALAGSYVTLSFTIKEGANQSFSHSVSSAVYCGTGAVAKRGGSAYTSETAVISASGTSSTSAARMQVTSGVVVPANTTQMEIQITVTPSGTAGADDSFTIDDLQLEAVASSASVASTFVKTPYSQQLKQCRRFLPVYNAPQSGTVNRYFAFGGAYGSAGATTTAYVLFNFPEPVRALPTGVVTNSAVTDFGVTDGTATLITLASMTLQGATEFGAILLMSVASGLTSGQASALGSKNNNAQLIFTGCEI